MAIIEVSNLSKTYRTRRKAVGVWAAVKGLFRAETVSVPAVRDVSFSIGEGELVGFLGPNGAGKTTTLKMLSGLLYPSAGRVEVMGFTPWERANDYRRSFALVLGQKNQLWWDLPAAESFLLNRQIYRIPGERYERNLRELSELLQVEKLLLRPVRELSLGERMKMELIGALLHDPRVLFLDEPTIGLDVVAQQAIRNCIREVNRVRLTTIILTSHQLRDVEILCDRVLVIHEGRLIFDGRLADIRERFSRHKIVTLKPAAGAVLPAAFAGAQVLEQKAGGAVSLLVERERVAAFCQEAFRRFALDDLAVEERPIEEVIAEYFTSGEEAT